MALLPPAKDIVNRAPVWVAMSDFFLDTELTDLMIASIARVCADSPYSGKELEKIMFTEVWPAFTANLFSVAGEWAGWDAEFVQKRILAFYKPRFYWCWKWNPIKRFFCPEWIKVECLVDKYRSGNAVHDFTPEL